MIMPAGVSLEILEQKERLKSLKEMLHQYSVPAAEALKRKFFRQISKSGTVGGSPDIASNITSVFSPVVNEGQATCGNGILSGSESPGLAQKS